ncbi:MAG TPA: hypothetical protein VN083_07840 [Vicinamibacteria bacterium]|jgi:hypothetical protein|nr:hypothetical protein [Vicinamibacteria bacterium]
MGLEADCRIDVDRERGEGRAHLEGDALVVRGGLRLRIPFSDVTAVSAEDGCLVVRFAGRRASFFLGPRAAIWAEKIRSPKGLMDKLGVRPESHVSLLGPFEPALLKEFKGRARAVSLGRVSKKAGLVFVVMTKRGDLGRLAGLRARLAPDGAIWVFWPKGQKGFREDDIRAALPQAGLVDVKVVSVSPLLSGLKIVIPRAQRP